MEELRWKKYTLLQKKIHNFYILYFIYMATTSSDLVILDVQEGATGKQEESFSKMLSKLFTRGGSINLHQKVVFFRIMATMVNANLTVLKSLTALKKQEKEKNMIKFYDFMIEQIQ